MGRVKPQTSGNSRAQKRHIKQKPNPQGEWGNEELGKVRQTPIPDPSSKWIPIISYFNSVKEMVVEKWLPHFHFKAGMLKAP